MAKKNTAIRLGIFIFVGIALFVITIFLIGDKNAMFSSTFTVKAYFRDIQGLKNGATVRLSGIDVGSVKGIEIVPDTTGRVQVIMNLRQEIQRFIKTDTKAAIETEGLVGNKVVVLHIGSANADQVGDNGVIIAVEPVSFSAIVTETKGIMEYTKQMTKDLSDIVGRVNKGEGSIGKLLVDDQLYTDATNLTRRADNSLKAMTSEVEQITVIFNELGTGVKRVVSNIDTITSSVDQIILGVQQGKGVLGAVLVDGTKMDSTVRSVVSNIDKTAYDARLAASRLAENMEALKHNWLFKSYFENRGYWDKAQYEDSLDSKIKDLNNKIKSLDDHMEKIKALESKR